MARYLLIRCEEDDSANKLIAKFAPLTKVKVVGLFVACSKFCECPPDPNRKMVKSKKWGTWHCRECKLPRKSMMHHPRNLLQDPTLHPRFADLFLSVWEPFNNDPEGVYGKDAIDRTRQQVVNARERLSRHKRRKARRESNGG